MKKLVAVFILVLLSVSTAGIAADDTEEFVVSNNKNKWQYGVSSAMATNGDVLVVWCEEVTPALTNFRVLSALCKLGANGEYTVGTPVQITTNLNSYFSTGAAYHPLNNTWAVVWAEKKGALGGGGIDIYGAELAANGSLKMGPVEIWSNSPAEYIQPYLFHIKKGLNAGRYLLLFTIRKFQTSEIYAGVANAILRDDLSIYDRVTTFYLVPYGKNIQSPLYPGTVTDVEQNNNGEFLVGVSAMDEKTLNVDGYLFRLNNNAQLLEKTKFNLKGDIYPVRLIKLKQDLFLSSFWTGNSDTISFWNRLYLGNLDAKGGAYQILPDREELYGDIVKLNKDKGAYSVVVSEGQIWGQYIRKTGKVKSRKDAPQLIAKGAGKAIDVFQAFCLPKSNRIFLLWQYKYTPEKREIRALVFDAQ